MPRFEPIEPVTRMTPFLASIIAGSTFWIAQNTLVRFTRRVCSNTSESNAPAWAAFIRER